MARVTYGGGVTEFAGSIGGVTFLRNASGPIAKLRSRPPVNPSPDQSLYNTRMAMLVAYWPTLSQANKDSWDALAAAHNHTTSWGESKTLSGYQWFLSCNLMRLIRESTPIATAPTWTVYDPPPSFTIETSDTYIRAAWSPDYDPPMALIFYASLPLRQSSLKLRRSLFYICHSYPVPSIPNFDLTSYIESLYNITWATFFASANCSIIIRIRHGYFYYGYFSAFTSAIVKIG